MRLATFNVLHGRSTADGRVDLDRYAGAVRDLDADVLALQEVDRDQPRSGGADLTAIAADAMGGATHRFLPALTGLPLRWSAATGAEPEGTPLYGVGLVSRFPVLSWQAIRLPAMPGRLPMPVPGRAFPVIVPDEPRVALVARIEAPGGPVSVASTHLSFVPGWNRRQLRRLLAGLVDADPLVLMGDLNMSAAVAVRTTGLRPLAPGATYPNGAPRRQLDHILARGAVRPVSPPQVHGLAVSDHCALSVEVSQQVAGVAGPQA